MNTQPQSLYNKDFNAWALGEAKKLKLKQFDAVDWVNLIEEIEDMSKRERKSLKSRLITLMMHLLKWQVQSENQCNSWRATIEAQRLEINKLLQEMPSLKNDLPVEIQNENNYKIALLKAVQETNLNKNKFPNEMPYSQAQLLDDEFYPDILS